MTELMFHGAARQVTGSMHVLRHNGLTLSLDCGMFQGHRAEARALNETYPLPPSEVDMVVLSHAHIDHSGRLPGLVKEGFRGGIFATPATRDLMGIMLPDSAHIQEEDARYWNTKRAISGDFIEPLYSMEDVVETLQHVSPIDCGDTFQLCPGCKATFLEAGHILGSAIVLLELEMGGQTRRILYSGDLGRFDLPILKDPTEPLPACDYLITECTYADRRHEAADGMREKLRAIIADTAQRGGKVIIPSFSVGRTQEVIYFLIHLYEDGLLPEVPIFVDSPLSTSATAVFNRHPECYDSELLKLWARGKDIFGQGGPVKFITDVEESKRLNQLKGTCVIISASGMCESGRILHHLKNNIEDEKNTVIIVGFMAQHTLGRRLVERRPEIKIYGRMYKLLARVEILNGFSAHADAVDFRRLYAPLAKNLRGAFIVHGEEKQPLAMKALLEELGCRNVAIPYQGQKFQLE